MGDVVTVRTAALGDAAEIQAIYSPIVEHTAVTFEEVPPTIDEMAGRIEETLLGYHYLVAERGGRVIGFAYAAPASHPRRIPLIS